MIIIDDTYFIGDVNLVIPTGTGFDLIMSKYEKRYLKEMLGQELADAFIAGLGEETIEEKWTNLKNAMIADADLKLSPVANYCYYFYVLKNETFQGSLGQFSSTAENAEKASPIYDIITTWNDAVTWNKDVIEFVKDNEETYVEYVENTENQLIKYKNDFNL